MKKSTSVGSDTAPVDLRRLAEYLNLSKATVSRALNDYADISQETKERVRLAAETLRYTPTTSARRLALGTSHTIGLILSGRGEQLATPFYSEFMASLATALGEKGYDLVVRAESEDQALEDYRSLIRTRKVDGFVLLRTFADDARVDYLIAQQFPFVTHGRTTRLAEHAWFDVDGEAAFRLATRHLIGLGHRRIGLITAGSKINSSLLRRAGHLQALEEAGIAPRPEWVVEGDLTARRGRTAAAELLALPEPPTALLCANDMTALGAIAGVRAGGLGVPGDISVIGYDGIAVGELLDPPLTTLAHSAMHSGEIVARMLLGRIAGDPPTAHQVLGEAQLLRRGSDAPPPTPQE